MLKNAKTNGYILLTKKSKWHKIVDFCLKICHHTNKESFMTHEERLEVYRQATELWGVVAQYDQAVEEMGELIVAINKFKRKVLYKEYKGDNSIIENLVEEIADVSICMEQMRDFYKDYGVEQVIEKKMEKFKGQIEAMKKQNNE